MSNETTIVFEELLKLDLPEGFRPATLTCVALRLPKVSSLTIRAVLMPLFIINSLSSVPLA